MIELFDLNLIAYVGPGIGGGIVVLILGFIMSFMIAVLAMFWYPVKRILKKIKKHFFGRKNKSVE